MKTHSIAIDRDLQVSGGPTRRMKFSRAWSNTRNAKGSQEASMSALSREHRARLSSSKLDAIHSRLNGIVQRIRLADRTTATIETFIDRMKARLKTILKQYPPFPPGSEERVRLLRSFNAFRKQIDQLTIPPREDFVKMVERNTKAFADSGGYGVSELVHTEEVHRSTKRFNIPEIREDASDHEVLVVLENLDAFSEIVRQRQAELKEDTATIIGELLEGGQVEDRTETNFEQRSLKLRDAIKAEANASLTKAQPQLTELL